MTNHIEQLMKVAGVKPYKRSYFECKGGRSTICLCPQIGDPNAWCKDECEEMQEKVEYLPPVFTPEKQLELEKLLMDKIGYIKIFHIPEIPAKMPESYTYNIYGGKFEFNSKNYIGETRPQALALLAIKAIEFNELDKSEVKKILED